MTGGDDRQGSLRFGIAGAAAVALVLVVYGGYAQHWSWIGINGHTATLWDWLHLVLLPLATVAVTLWLRHRPRFGRVGRAAITGAGIAFLAVVLAGYTVPWAWTGFTGNTLWDWLNLAALPLVIAMIPVALELRGTWERRHLVWLAACVAVFAALVLAGYLAAWRWTGFTGNTVWNWLNLLLLPLLVPTVMIPLLRPTIMARMGVAEEESAAQPAPRQPSSEPATPMAERSKRREQPQPDRMEPSAPRSDAPKAEQPAVRRLEPTHPSRPEPPTHPGHG